ncbi:MAG: PQQ-binding-like beta-propeller repeat protein [Planctomycetaceae bacterium]
MAQEEFDENGVEDTEIGQQTARARRQLSRGRFAQITEKLTGGPERPGEQRIGRSPVVLGLIGTTIGALLLAGIFWFMNANTREERQLKEALTSLEQQRYLDAEGQFVTFLANYSQSASAAPARIGLHRTRVEKHIMTEFPDVARGLDELNELIRVCRDLPGFDDLKEYLPRYADRLTFAGARVAEVTQEKQALDASIAAMEIMKRYAGENGIPAAREQELVRMQRLASASVAKKTEFQSRVTEIRGLLESKQTIEALEVRSRLIDAYPGLSDDKDLNAILAEILNQEKASVIRSEGADALTQDASPADVHSLALTLRTQAATDLSSQGRSVFACGMDSVYALDSDTGEPLWRKTIGVDSPFAPVPLTGTEPGILIYSSLTGELQLLSQKAGRLLWRQPLEGRPNATPLVVANNILITTDHSEVWQLAVANGRTLARLKFSQPIIGPPAISSDGLKLVVPGDEALVYTLSLNPLSCVAASQIPHKAGSVKAPMLAAGKYFLLCDNVTADKARIQTLNIDNDGGLHVEATDPVDGNIFDPCLLRGYDLFVPSSPQRVTVFRVTEEAGQPPLSRVGTNQLEDGLQTRMFLLAGPSAQLWLGGRDLRKFQIRTNTVLLDSGVTAEGIHLQPIQFVDEAVFLTTRNPQSTSVFFTRANREEMKGIWRTVLGSRIVAIGPAAGGDSVLVIADYGEAFRIPMSDIAKGGFQLESVSRFRLPEKLMTPVGGATFKDGRVAAWCGAPEPSMWTFTPTGQLERKWTLPDSPELPPVSLDAGVVFAMPGRLHLAGTAGGRAAEDYRATQTQNQQQPWKSLTAISPNQVLAVNAENQFVRVEFRTTPRPQLAELSVTNVPYLIELPPAVSGEHLFLATTDGKLVMLQTSTLQVLADTDLGLIPGATPKAVGNFVLVELANKEVRVFRTDNGLQVAGTFPLDGYALADDPVLLPDMSCLVARTDGSVIRINPDGTVSETVTQLGQAIQQGPLMLNGRIIVIGLDGSLYQLNENTGK